MPSMLTVMLSWLTFWVDMDAGNQVNVQFFIIFLMYGIITRLTFISTCIYTRVKAIFSFIFVTVAVTVV